MYSFIYLLLQQRQTQNVSKEALLIYLVISFLFIQNLFIYFKEIKHVL